MSCYNKVSLFPLVFLFPLLAIRVNACNLSFPIRALPRNLNSSSTFAFLRKQPEIVDKKQVTVNGEHFRFLRVRVGREALSASCVMVYCAIEW